MDQNNNTKDRSSRLTHRAHDDVATIRNLLDDVYEDNGDGRTLIRELVQNADDAKAKRLVLALVDGGWPHAKNSLLHGPALVVVNDGPCPKTDCDALLNAIGGSKAADADKVGRFGLGLKSVFHICEAFVYVGANGGDVLRGALNPWNGTGADNNADPIHPDWDIVNDDDEQKVLTVAQKLLGPKLLDGGLVLWLPLRQAAHCDREKNGSVDGLSTRLWKTNDVQSWFDAPDSLALLLAQCGNLRSIEVIHASSPDNCDDRQQLVRVCRDNSAWVGRPTKDDSVEHDRHFSGRVSAGAHGWMVSGAEALGSNSLRELKQEQAWPRDDHYDEDGRRIRVPRKALAHAAVTVMRADDKKLRGARLRWAVFFPLDDNAAATTNPVVEAYDCAVDSAAWEIMLHGYFWPAQDRRSIPGVTDTGSNEN